MKRRAIAIVRVSTDQQDMERQRRDKATAAHVHNLTVARTLELDGVSGTTMLSNAEVGRVLDDLARPDVDGVIVSSIDRLTRPGELGHLAIFDAFQRTRKKIWTPGQEIDLTTQTGFLMAGIQGVLSGHERMTILQRMAGGKETVRLRGGHADGPASLPRGVTYSKQSGWSYVEPGASQVKQAYGLLFERRSWSDIAERIGWENAETVRRTLHNTVWKGIRTYTEGRDTPLEVPMGIEPLITPVRWEAAQRIMIAKTDDWNRSKRPGRFLLPGLLTCSCGKPMYVRCGSRRHKSYYYCSSYFRPEYGPKCGAHSVQTQPTDQEVIRIVSALDPAFLRVMLDSFQSGQPARNQDATKIARERVKLEAERQRLLRMTLKGTCTEADFERESKRIEGELASLDNLAPAPVGYDFDPAKLVVQITRTFARFTKQPFEEQRDVLRNVVKDIVVEGGAIPAMTLNGGFLTGTKLPPRLTPLYSRQCREPGSKQRAR